MNPQLQGSTPTLQGGGTSGISLQGSSPSLQVTRNPQPGAVVNQQNLPNVDTSFSNPLSSQLASNQAGINQSQDQYGKLLQQILATERSLSQKPLAPTLDYNAIQANAKAAATANVNPLYTQKLNEYLQNEAAAKTEQQNANQLAIQSAQSSLQNTLGQNQIAQGTAEQKNALNVGNINQQESNYQTNQGTSFDMKRRALQESLGAGNLTASGVGQQQLWQAENLRHVEEAQQTGQFQYNRNMANLEKSNTFAQLAQSGEYAKTQEGQAEAKANFDLNSYLRQASYEEEKFREENEQQKQADILNQTNEASKQQVAQFVAQFKNNPAIYNAALNAYGGLMR